MPSRADWRSQRRVLTACLVGIIVALASISTQSLAAEDTSKGKPSEAEVRRALDAVKADPNLATETTRSVPSFGPDAKSKERPNEKRSITSPWIRNLFKWMNETSRALLWVVGIILATLLLVTLLRVWRNADLKRATKIASALPTHVRDLDIRPESLPDLIGAAALALWEKHEHRAALVLLYRGLVSRLVHVRSLPIRESTTEAGCIELAREHLPAELVGYVVQLVRCWQRAVYGGMEPTDSDFRALCASFDSAMTPPPGMREAA